MVYQIRYLPDFFILNASVQRVGSRITDCLDTFTLHSRSLYGKEKIHFRLIKKEHDGFMFASVAFPPAKFLVSRLQALVSVSKMMSFQRGNEMGAGGFGG